MTRIVEELCQDSDCHFRADSHWHPLSLESLMAEGPGEYTLTVRVRNVKTTRARKSGRSA